MGYSKQLLALTEATYIAGLRPIEWQSAIVILNAEQLDEHTLTDFDFNYSGGYPSLLVENAKATNGRSFGRFRCIDLSEVSEQGITFIKIACFYAHKMPLEDGKDTADVFWEKYYDKLRFSLYRVVQKILGKKGEGISLYTFRHQCIANLKAIRSPEELAVMVGHGNDITATEHYGKQRYA